MIVLDRLVTRFTSVISLFGLMAFSFSKPYERHAKQILNEAFQHVILESCLRYRYQKEARGFIKSIELEQRNFTVFQIIDPITIPIKVDYLSIWILGNIVIYIDIGYSTTTTTAFAIPLS